MQILVEDVQVPERVRKETGNLDSLMESLQRCGQLNPIVVTRDMRLVAGFRRLSSAKRLGWRMIEANVVDGVDEIRVLEMELEENVLRKDFTPEEILDGYKRLEKLRHPNAMRRIGRAISKFFSALAFWRRLKKRPAGLPAAPAPVTPPAVTGSAAPADSGKDEDTYGV